jgi:hypothetical protein
MLVFGITNPTVAISMFFFNFCWIFVDIYQAATIANVDHSGRFPAMIPAAQGLGNFLGPNMAASVLAFGFGYNGVFILCASASITAMLVYLYMYYVPDVEEDDSGACGCVLTDWMASRGNFGLPTRGFSEPWRKLFGFILQ